MTRMIWRPGMADFIEVEPGYTPRRRSGPFLFGDYEAYESPVTGELIEGRHAHQEDLKRHGCRLLEPGESKEAPRRMQEAADRDTEALADRMAQTMSELLA